MVRFFACSVFPLLNGVTRSPSVMGILVADRKFFGEIGSLDGGMKIYGGENVELGIRVSKLTDQVLLETWRFEIC